MYAADYAMLRAAAADSAFACRPEHEAAMQRDVAAHAALPPVNALIVALVRNEGAWLPEWIEHHALLGVGRFAHIGARSVLRGPCRGPGHPVHGLHPGAGLPRGQARPSALRGATAQHLLGHGLDLGSCLAQQPCCPLQLLRRDGQHRAGHGVHPAGPCARHPPLRSRSTSR